MKNIYCAQCGLAVLPTNLGAHIREVHVRDIYVNAVNQALRPRNPRRTRPGSIALNTGATKGTQPARRNNAHSPRRDVGTGHPHPSPRPQAGQKGGPDSRNPRRSAGLPFDDNIWFLHPDLMGYDAEELKQRALDLSTTYSANLKNIIKRCEQLDPADKLDCLKYSKIPMYSALIALVFIHVSLGPAATEHVMKARLKHELDAWEVLDLVELLVRHRSIKESLLGFLHLNTDHAHRFPPDLEEQVNESIIPITGILVSVLTDPEQLRKVLSLKGDKATSALDLLQAAYDHSHLDRAFKPLILNALILLGQKSGCHPRSSVIPKSSWTDLDFQPTTQRTWVGSSLQASTFRSHLLIIKTVYPYGKFEEVLPNFAAEAAVWRNLRHPNLMPFYGTYIEPRPSGGPLSFVLPFFHFKNEDLMTYLWKHPDANRPLLLLDVARGLRHLHSMKPVICYGKLRPECILITDSGRACISDFGFALVNNILLYAHDLSVIRKWPPENPPRYTPQMDMYSFGCLCYEVHSGRLLRLHQSMVLSTKEERAELGMTGVMAKFILSCCKEDPSARPTAEQAVKRLKDMLVDVDLPPPADAEFNDTVKTELIGPVYDPFSLPLRRCESPASEATYGCRIS
ncbi:kinase-like protein [Leucogyrophana mollusca]|uniref:Kinase-like protein n=1 Tax=Leucogyrophana mollusca TaxID=85980 RepID=A0ACB8BN45_9AGAM|nr:kinase-like protein [Leucogyrophana mollusca]